MPRNVLEEGTYCPLCGYFEDELEVGQENCMSCGCEAAIHIKAQIVAME